MNEVREDVRDTAAGSDSATQYARALDVARQDCTDVSALRVAYLINQYPKVSHSFIRREILALERQGVTVDRIAIRGWDADVVDPADISELGRTRFVLKEGIVRLLVSALRECFKQPRSFAEALGHAFAFSRRSERSLAYHLIYLAQACHIQGWLRDTNVSHLHAHFGTNPAEIAMFVRLLGGPPYSFTAHGADESDNAGRLGFDRKIGHAKFVVAVSSNMRSQLYRHIDPANWPKVQVVHCGLAPDYFDQAAPPLSSIGRIVCVGRLSSEKGQLLLLQAMQRVAEKHRESELVLAGDGDMRGLLEQRIRELGLQNRVRITGWLTSAQVREEILSARVLVVPSFQEGLPIVIMEAMALKRPVIATHVAGIPELVLDDDTGWLVPAGSVEDLTEAIDRCLTTPIGDLRRMGERAFTRVAERHAIEREAEKLAALFRNPAENQRMTA